MYCEKCGSEWNSKNDYKKCPFCGEFLEKSPLDFLKFEQALKYIVDTFGAETYNKPSVFLSYVSDFAPSFVDERRLLKLCSEIGAFKTLLMVREKNATEQQDAQRKISYELQNHCYLNKDMAEKAVFWIAFSLGLKSVTPDEINIKPSRYNIPKTALIDNDADKDKTDKIANTIKTKNNKKIENQSANYLYTQSVESGFNRLRLLMWNDAEKDFDNAINASHNARAYLGKMMAQLHIKEEKELLQFGTEFEKNDNWQLAMQNATGSYKDKLIKIEEQHKQYLEKKSNRRKNSSIVFNQSVQNKTDYSLTSYVGKRLDGRYEIREIIGVGGIAVVYKAYDNIDDRIVAVKVYKEEFLANEAFRRKFKNESKAIAVIAHPNITKVYDVSYGDRLQYIVMEYIEGITLKEYIEYSEQHERISRKEAINLIVQILRALQYAHDKGIVHSDIKPQNIMLMKNGKIKIMDFGNLRRSKNDMLYSSSVHYISPEQASEMDETVQSNIYSVGIMLYEMLTGRRPFEADNSVSVALMHIQNKPVLPTKINSDIPIGLEQIVIKAMQKNPADRYQSAAEMLLDLDTFSNNNNIIFDYKNSNDFKFDINTFKLSTPSDWRAKGLCQHCGGKFKGLFTKKCSECGKTKDY